MKSKCTIVLSTVSQTMGEAQIKKMTSVSCHSRKDLNDMNVLRKQLNNIFRKHAFYFEVILRFAY
jgi:hypothetical protein